MLSFEWVTITDQITLRHDECLFDVPWEDPRPADCISAKRWQYTMKPNDRSHWISINIADNGGGER